MICTTMAMVCQRHCKFLWRHSVSVLDGKLAFFLKKELGSFHTDP